MKYLLRLIVFLCISALSMSFGQSAKVGQKAADFTLKDSEGQVHKLSQYKGKYVVLEWINFGCPFVKKHYTKGNMQSLQKKYTTKGIVWLSICSSAEGKQGYFEGQELKDLISKKQGNQTAYLVDADGTVGKMYGARTTPHMFVINPEGNLIYTGAIDDTPSTDSDDIAKSKNYVAMALDAALAKKAIEVTSSQPYGCSVKY